MYLGLSFRLVREDIISHDKEVNFTSEDGDKPLEGSCLAKL